MEKEKYNGSVIWFCLKKGYGFIGWAKNGVQQTDLFLHFSDIVMPGFKLVKKNDIVTFSIGMNNRGDPKAIDVVVINHEGS